MDKPCDFCPKKAVIEIGEDGGERKMFLCRSHARDAQSAPGISDNLRALFAAASLGFGEMVEDLRRKIAGPTRKLKELEDA